MYSDISILTIFDSSSKSCSASALATSVLPTPVGPRKRNEPIGRLISPILALLRNIASDTSLRASSWPITLCERILSRFKSFCLSVDKSLLISIWVHLETTSAIVSSFTTSLIILELLSSWVSFDTSFSSSGIV